MILSPIQSGGMIAVLDLYYSVLDRDYRDHMMRVAYAGAVWQTSLNIRLFSPQFTRWRLCIACSPHIGSVEMCSLLTASSLLVVMIN